MSKLRLVVLCLGLVLALPVPLVSFSFSSTPASEPGGASVQAAVAPGEPVVFDAAASRERAGRSNRGKKAKKSGGRTREAEPAVDCEAMGLQTLPLSGMCTHGPDPAPPGYDVDKRVRALSSAQVRKATAGAEFVCQSDGSSGNRIQALYIHVDGGTNRYNQYAGSFQSWLAGADQILYASAAEAGGSRRFRFVMTPSCQVDVQQVALSASAMTNFDQMLRELQQRGFNRRDRFYMSFVDSTAAGICGLGTLSGDDRPGPENYNNFGPAYSRVDAGCWSDLTVAHELMHNLGGVALSSPNSSGYGHCIDDYDVMCYQDGTPHKVRVVCGDPALEYRFDCGKDDYFHPNPPAGSYLATHWNTANNVFLVADGQALARDTVAIASPRPGARLKGKKRVTITASADARAGVTAVEFRACKGRGCGWDAASTIGYDQSAPFTTTRKLPKKGVMTYYAAMIDANGVTTISDPVTVKVKKKRRR